MSKIEFPINRKDIYFDYIIATDGSTILKKRNIIFLNHSYDEENLKNAIDLNYDSPKYEYVYLKNGLSYFKEKKPKKSKLQIGFSPANYCNLNSLLAYFGFDKILTKEDYLDVMNHLFNGKFPYEHCEDFGYQRKSQEKWKNGILISNPKMQNLSMYERAAYERVDAENSLSPYFSVLTSVNHLNPEVSFMPFEEEGPIRKRIL